MKFTPRWYQEEAINAGVNFMQGKKVEHGILICPTGSGKSVIIANIASRLEGKTVVFQPSKEILQQNYAKFCSYGFRAGIYSASAGIKFIDTITFATIGSVARKPHLFKQFKNIIIDECHLVNAEEGMYKSFIESLVHAKVLGLTATPYRLSTSGYGGAMLRFITRTRPRIFSKVLYYIQNDVLFNEGFLAPLKYYSFNLIDRSQLEMNKQGTDFTDASVRAYMRKVDMPSKTIEYAHKLLNVRRNLLIFCSLIYDANIVAKGIPGAVVVHGETPAEERDRILNQFKKGIIRCVVNVGVLTTGFDYPALEAVLISRSTMSLALYYQIVGRVMRPYKYADGAAKEGWVVDLGGNIDFFGKIETMKITHDEKGKFIIKNNGRQLTNIEFTKK